MAGMTDTAFRRLVKREGGCGLVVTEMVSSEGLVRGIDRTLEFAEYTEEERPVSIQIFGGDPAKMAEAAQIVEGMGADIVDVNMGCPVPKIAKHNAGCSLMREPEHAASVISAMTEAVNIPVTVKMRAGWNDRDRNAPTVAKMMQDAGASAIAVHGRTAEQSYSGQADWDLVAQMAHELTIPVLGSGDCLEPRQILERLATGVAGVLVGRGVLRNPWILAQASDLIAGRSPREVTLEDRGRFLLEYIELLQTERIREPEGFRHVAPAAVAPRGAVVAPVFRPVESGVAPVFRPAASAVAPVFRPAVSVVAPVFRPVDKPAPPFRPANTAARSHDRWIINKIRALASWYTKGLDNGSHLRTSINSCDSLPALRDLIATFFEVGLLVPSE
jgi:nifR3 family TIM-barrel protein